MRMVGIDQAPVTDHQPEADSTPHNSSSSAPWFFTSFWLRPLHWMSGMRLRLSWRLQPPLLAA